MPTGSPNPEATPDASASPNPSESPNPNGLPNTGESPNAGDLAVNTGDSLIPGSGNTPDASTGSGAHGTTNTDSMNSENLQGGSAAANSSVSSDGVDAALNQSENASSDSATESQSNHEYVPGPNVLDTPKTGDDNMLSLWYALSVMMAFAALWLVRKSKKEN